MKYIIGLMAMLLPILSGAQSPPVKALSIGDTVPDIVFNNIINYKTSSAKLSDFKGDLVLLDFWSTWCSACIRCFPELDSFKKKFDKKLDILLVNAKSKSTNDNETKILNTLSKLKERRGVDIHLPVVYNNDLLDSYFPVLYIPQVIWLRKNKVIAITGSDEVTERNITQILSGFTPDFHMKKDLPEYNRTLPLFINKNGGDGDQMIFRSMVTKYIEGVGAGSGFREIDHKITGLYILNHSLLALVKKGYGDLMAYPDNRILNESKNQNFKVKNSEDYKYSLSFCYELVLPPSTEKQVWEYMRSDLRKYFRITAHKEIRKMKCMVLSKTKEYKPESNKTAIKSMDIEKETKKKYIYNRTMPFVVSRLNGYSLIPIIDESQDTTSIISIDLPFNLTDVKELQCAFKKIGLDLKEEERGLEVMVISDL